MLLFHARLQTFIKRTSVTIMPLLQAIFKFYPVFGKTELSFCAKDYAFENAPPTFHPNMVRASFLLYYLHDLSAANINAHEITHRSQFYFFASSQLS